MFKRYLKLLFIIWMSVLYMGCEQSPFDWIGDQEIVKVTDIEVTNVTGGTATVLFTVKKTKDMSLKDIRVECRQEDNAYLVGTFEPDFLGDGRYQVKLSDLISTYIYEINIHASVGNEEEVEIGQSRFTTADITGNMPYIERNVLTSNRNNFYFEGNIRHRSNELPLTEMGIIYYSGAKKDIYNKVKANIKGDNYTIDIEKLDWSTSYTFYIYLASGDEKYIQDSMKEHVGIPFYINVRQDQVVNNYSATFNFDLDCYDSGISDITLSAYAQSGVSTGNLSEPYWANSTVSTDNKGGTVYFYGLSGKTTYVWHFTVINWVDKAGKKHSANIERKNTNEGQSGAGNYFIFKTN